MKKLFIGLALSLALYAEKDFKFTPALLIEAEISQGFTKDESKKLPKAEIGLGKVEAGFEIEYEKVTGIVNFEYDSEDEGRILLNEAVSTVSATDKFSISAGLFVNSFGMLTSEALSDPLILDNVETKAPGLQLDLEGKKFFGSLTLYQGVYNENFQSFVPALGLQLNERFTAKISSRIEVLEDTSYVDLSAAVAVQPIELLKFQAELYSELFSKNITNDEESSNSKALGYYAEIALYPKEVISIVGRFDQRINDLDADTKSGLMAIELSGGYQFFDPFCVHAGLTFMNDYLGSTDNWNSLLTLQAAFEL